MRYWFVFLFIYCFEIHGEFRFNRDNNLVLPSPEDVHSYTELNRDEQGNLGTLLQTRAVQDSLDQNLLARYNNALSEYKRETQLINSHKQDQALEALDSLYRQIISGLTHLQNRDPTAFDRHLNDPSFKVPMAREGPAGLPRFCENYPQTNPNDIEDFFEGTVRQGDNVYEGCLGDRQFSVELQNVVTTLAEIEDRNFKIQEQIAKENLMTFVTAEILENRRHYEGLFPDLPVAGDNEFLQSCLKRRKQTLPEFARKTSDQLENVEVVQTPQVQSALRNNFMTFHASQALVASAYLKQLSEARSKLLSFQRQGGGVDQRRCAR